MCPENNYIFLYCNQISLRLKYGREKEINEICTCQGHIYLVCFKNIFYFFYNLQSTNYVMTPCVTPLSQRLEEFLHCRRLSSKLKSNRPLQQILRILKAADSVDSQETRWTEKNRENDGMTNRKRKHQTNNRWDLYIANK